MSDLLDTIKAIPVMFRAFRQERLERDKPWYQYPLGGWTCFHCGANFTNTGAAAVHFGERPSMPVGCSIDLQEYRRMRQALHEANMKLLQEEAMTMTPWRTEDQICTPTNKCPLCGCKYVCKCPRDCAYRESVYDRWHLVDMEDRCGACLHNRYAHAGSCGPCRCYCGEFVDTRCPECEEMREICPDAKVMCYVCCASGTAQLRAMGSSDIADSFTCRCEDREELQGVDLLEVNYDPS